MLPWFLIIGAQRAGTSSLYRYLASHPRAKASLRKEVQYFSTEYHRGLDWYKAHFPLQTIARERGRRAVQPFEATPDYLLHPYAAERAAELVPDARIIVLLRDPVDRAFSHYQHVVRLGMEPLSFEESLDAEPSRIGGDLERLERDPLHDARALLRFSYYYRGLYADQLKRWMKHFPEDRVLVIHSRDLFTEPSDVLHQIEDFLSLPRWLPRRFENYSYRTGVSPRREIMPVHVRERLKDAYREPNSQLFGLIGRDLSWQ